MIEIPPERMADAMAATVLSRGRDGFPGRAEIDSRLIEGGELFFGLPGESDDGGRFARTAAADGAWGIVAGPGFAEPIDDVWVFEVLQPLAALQDLATAWRRELGSTVVGITGSVGKTSVKDITRALLPGAVHASPENFNTEVGLPLTVLSAPAGTGTLVLEMAMRGSGQIAELTLIAEPDVGVITNVGPVHIELLGSIEAVAAAKAEMIAGLRPKGRIVVPADGGHLEPHLKDATGLLRFGPGGDVELIDAQPSVGGIKAVVSTPRGRQEFEFPFTESHNLTNALTAIAVGIAVGAEPAQMAAQTPQIAFSKLRGEHLELENGTLVVNDSYNANPVSMAAALDYLAGLDRPNRVAVMGLMAELGPDAGRYHAEIGKYARDVGIDVLIGVGRVAAGYGPDHLVDDPAAAVELLSGLIGPDSAVLVKGSRAAGLEAVAEGLLALPESGGAS